MDDWVYFKSIVICSTPARQKAAGDVFKTKGLLTGQNSPAMKGKYEEVTPLPLERWHSVREPEGEISGLYMKLVA